MTRSPLPYLILLLTLVLVGCTTSEPIQTNTRSTIEGSKARQQWHDHQQKIQSLTQWQLFGKVGFRTTTGASSANIKWQQQDENFSINLSGPFGKSAAELNGTPNKVRIKIAGQGEFETDQPEQFLLQRTGWEIPVNTLWHWVRGIPSPGQEFSYELDQQGRLSRLTQAQWQLEYQSYQQPQSLWLPKKIQLQRDDLKLTLIIKGWTYPAHKTS